MKLFERSDEGAARRRIALAVIPLAFLTVLRFSSSTELISPASSGIVLLTAGAGIACGAWCVFYGFQLINLTEVRHPIISLICLFLVTLFMVMLLSPKIEETLEFSFADGSRTSTLAPIVRVQRGSLFFSSTVFVRAFPAGKAVRVPITNTTYNILSRKNDLSRICVDLEIEKKPDGAVRVLLPDIAITITDLMYCGPII